MMAREFIILAAVAHKTSGVTRVLLNADLGVFLAVPVLHVWIKEQADAAVRAKLKYVRTALRMSHLGTLVEQRCQLGSHGSCHAGQKRCCSAKKKRKFQFAPVSSILVAS